MLPVGSAARSALIVALIALSSASVFAQNEAQRAATAESLFREARELMAQERFAEACVKFEASQRLEEGLGTLLNLADCHEKLGRSASAWAEFLRASALASRAGQSDREAIARERALRLEPLLTRLRVTVEPDAMVNGLEVLRGEATLAEATWGSAIPVDPGDYRVIARAPGKVEYSTSVQLARPGETVEVTIPRLQDLPTTIAPQAAKPLDGQPLATQPAATEPSVATAPATTLPASAGPMPVPDRPGTSAEDTQRVLGLVLGGAGVLGLVGGGSLALIAKGEYDSADCRNGFCPDEDAQAQAEDALSLANAATVVTAIGGGLAVVGAGLYFLAPPTGDRPTEEHANAWRVAPVLTHQSGGVWVSGDF